MAAIPLQPGSNLACQSFEFMSLWDKVVKPGCVAILQKPFEGLNVTPLFTAVYRLASNPCLKVPVLIRGSQNERVETPDMTAQQCLVLYYLLRELLKEHLEKTVLSPEGALKSAFANPTYPAEFANVYVDEWYKMFESLKRLKAVFNYLQNHWHTLHMQNTNIFFNVMSMGMNMWNDHVLGPVLGPHRSKLTEITLGLYSGKMAVGIPSDLSEDDEANSSASDVDRAQRLLRDVTDSLIDLDQHISHSAYTQVFDIPLKQEMSQKYRGAAGDFFDVANLFGSLQLIRRAVVDEESRIEKCTSQRSTVQQVRTTVLDELLVKGERLDVFLNAVSGWLVSDIPNSEALSLLHSLLQNSSSGLRRFRESFEDSVYKHGLGKLKAVSDGNSEAIDIDFIRVIVDACNRVKSVASQSFGEDADMRISLEEGCKRLVAKNGLWERDFSGISPLARYVHSLAISGQIIVADSPVSAANSSYEHSVPFFNATSEMALYLFGLLPSDKSDEFLEQYHRDLSRRLLYLNCVDVDVERALVKKLARIHGTREHVHRFAMMIQEYEQSQHYIADRKARAQFGLTALVNYWPWPRKAERYLSKAILNHPDFDVVPIQLPTNLSPKTMVDRWMPGVSHACIQTNPMHFVALGKPLDITLSHLQAVISLKFQPVSVASIQLSSLIQCFARPVGMSAAGVVSFPYPYLKDDVVEAVWSLTLAGLLVLEGQAKANFEDLLTNDFRVSLNADFNPYQKFVGGVVDSVDFFTPDALFPQCEKKAIFQGIRDATSTVLVSSPGGGKSAIAGLMGGGEMALSENARKSLIQAYIVQITKKVEKISHLELMASLSEVLRGRFEPSPAEMKGEVEKLIEKEFLERVPNEQGVYKYLP